MEYVYSINTIFYIHIYTNPSFTHLNMEDTSHARPRRLVSFNWPSVLVHFSTAILCTICKCLSLCSITASMKTFSKKFFFYICIGIRSFWDSRLFVFSKRFFDLHTAKKHVCVCYAIVISYRRSRMKQWNYFGGGGNWQTKHTINISGWLQAFIHAFDTRE